MKTMAMASAMVFLLVGGLAVSQTEDELEDFKRNCNSGVPADCLELGSWYNDILPDSWPLERRDEALATQLFQKACDGGVAYGCYSAGRVFSGKDENLSVKFWEKGCDLGDQSSCVWGARTCYPLNGILHDSTRAVAFLQKACDLLHGDSCFRMALYFDLGMFVTKDTDRANELLKKACLFGHEVACEKFTH